jgi:triosephosphate isomerase (TIM)
MRQIFVNLKRFEVPREKGGLCPLGSPVEWINTVIDETAESGLGQMDRLKLVYLLPEGLIPAAVERIAHRPAEQTRQLAVGSQGVHWEDIQPGGNFGAFTTSLPATASYALGSRWAIVGHSEERKARRQVMASFSPGLEQDPDALLRANRAIDRIVGSEVGCALNAGLKALICIGETAEERGTGEFAEQKPRVEAVLKAQILEGLKDAGAGLQDGRVVIGYEPVWAIGPGKTPPGKEYIGFVSAFIKDIARENFAAEPAVVYGGGLKEENAGMIAGIETIDGGLVALTRFTGQIGFHVSELKRIAEKYLSV